MLSWGMEDQDFALKCWLMGHSMLVDPELVVAHRFVAEHTEYTSSPFEHLLMNRIPWRGGVSSARSGKTGAVVIGRIMAQSLVRGMETLRAEPGER